MNSGPATGSCCCSESLRGTFTPIHAAKWTISVEHRGEQVEIDHLFYKWLRCELVHTGSLPYDLRIDAEFADPTSLAIQACGAPDFTVLVGPRWFHLLVRTVMEAPVTGDLRARGNFG